MTDPAHRAEAPRPARGVLLLVALATCVAWWLHAEHAAADGRHTRTTLVLALAVFTLMPAVMAAAMLAVLLVPLAVLGPVALGARLWTGRPTGLRSLLGGLCATGLAVVPGYVRALRRIRSPLAWGVVGGSAAAAAFLLATTPAAAAG